MVLVPAPARITRTSRSAASKTVPRHLRAADDEHVVPGDPAGQVVRAQSGLHLALVAVRLEVVDRLVGQLVREENAHATTSGTVGAAGVGG